jgi:hypothetical protein
MEARHNTHGSIRLALFAVACSVVMTASAANIQIRPFNPLVQTYIAGFGDNVFGHTDLICGVQLEADCYGRWQGYVRETTPGGKAICAALMYAKAQQTPITIHLNVTNPAQCEIVRVELP